MNWTEVAKRIGKGLTERQCRDRYLGFLSPALSNRPFTADEDKAMVDLVKTYGTKWKKIAEVMKTNRSNIMVRNRYYTLKRKYGANLDQMDFSKSATDPKTEQDQNEQNDNNTGDDPVLSIFKNCESFSEHCDFFED